MTFEILDTLRSETLHDSVAIGDAGFIQWGNGGGVRSMRLFGNSNIGNAELCNLQIPGGMPGHQTFVVQRWYARNNFPDTQAVSDRVKAWANSVVTTFIIGNKTRWQRSLFELFERRPRTSDVTPRSAADPFPALVPVRQSLQVQLETFGDNIDTLVGMMRSIHGEEFRPRVWIHLEGVVLDTDDPTAYVAGEKLIAALMNIGVVNESIETQIARWLGVQIEDASPENRAQLHAVRDGILEGRHRS